MWTAQQPASSSGQTKDVDRRPSDDGPGRAAMAQSLADRTARPMPHRLSASFSRPMPSLVGGC